jgi:predicted nucleotidyltransferase component of viral defense system
MIENILQTKMLDYAPKNSEEQENALAEVFQHFVLAALARTGFFSVAQFHGGTFLRIVHGLERFSEDLDFVLKVEDCAFEWERYLEPTIADLEEDGFSIEVVDRSSVGSAVKKAFLKTDSIGKQITVSLPHGRHPRQKLRVKLEVDTVPPSGSAYETAFFTFPVATAFTVQTLPSAFASKSHALLCRNYVKGRDWFDFLWYVERGVVPNFDLLENAVHQAGPWSGQEVAVTPHWYLARLEEAIGQVDWDVARADVERFLSGRNRVALALWGVDLFRSQLARLRSLLS